MKQLLIVALLIIVSLPCYALNVIDPLPAYTEAYREVITPVKIEIVPITVARIEIQNLQDIVKLVRINYYMQNKDYDNLRKDLSGVLSDDKAEVLIQVLKGEKIYPAIGKPQFFTGRYKWADYPSDEGTMKITDVLTKSSEDSHFLFTPALWEFYGKEAIDKVKGIYFRSKQNDPNRPVGLCVGYLHDSRPDELIKGAEGYYDWLVIWIGRWMPDIPRYDWSRIYREWSKKCGNKPIIVAGIWVEKGKHEKDIENFNNTLKKVGFAGGIFYEK